MISFFSQLNYRHMVLFPQPLSYHYDILLLPAQSSSYGSFSSTTFLSWYPSPPSSIIVIKFFLLSHLPIIIISFSSLTYLSWYPSHPSSIIVMVSLSPTYLTSWNPPSLISIIVKISYSLSQWYPFLNHLHKIVISFPHPTRQLTYYHDILLPTQLSSASCTDHFPSDHIQDFLQMRRPAHWSHTRKSPPFFCCKK